MSKNRYPTEFKLFLVEQQLKEHVSIRSLSAKYNVSASVISEWCAAYLEHGKAGLCTTHQTYSGDFKVSVVEYMHNTGTSLNQTAKHFNIHSRKTISKWEQVYNEKGKDALYHKNRLGRPPAMGKKQGKPKEESTEKSKSEKKSYEELEAEVEDLRMENEYLKKLNALVQEREKSEKKTK